MPKLDNNPIEMAQLFEKLEAQGPAQSAQFLSDHQSRERIRRCRTRFNRCLGDRTTARIPAVLRIKDIVTHFPLLHSCAVNTTMVTRRRRLRTPVLHQSKHMWPRITLDYPATAIVWRSTIGHGNDSPPMACCGIERESVDRLRAIVSYYFPQTDEVELSGLGQTGDRHDDLVRQMHKPTRNARR